MAEASATVLQEALNIVSSTSTKCKLGEYDGMAAHLKHGLLQDEVLPPELRDVLLHRAAWGAKVKEACHAPIDLEGGNCEQLAFHDTGLQAVLLFRHLLGHQMEL